MDFAKRLALTFSVFCFTLVACSENKSFGLANSKLSAPTFEKRPKGTLYSDQGYFEYLPAGYEEETLSPLIIFFHGLGENGNGSEQSLDLVLKNAIPNLINNGEWPEDRPFVVLSPQQQWSCPSAQQIRKFIEFALSHYKIDPARVYLTGLSCGGMGIATYLATYGGDLITAVVPVAGNMWPAWNAKRCGFTNDVAVWTFTGEQDSNFGNDRQAMNNLISCPQPRKDMRFTSYPNTGHNSWDKAYAEDIYSWMLSYSKPAP